MKVTAINGSPRKNWNTVALLKKSLEGVASIGAETDLIHLYDLDFKGCCSCFACKKKESNLNGHCAMKDDLTEVLKKVKSSDILIFGSPIYLGNITGEMKSFIERLIFANLSYDSANRTNFMGTIQTGFIYTMGLPHEMIKSFGYHYIFENNKNYLKLLNGHSEYIISADCYQFDDYSKYAASNFNAEHKGKIRKKQFPIDCQNAFKMGEKLASYASNQGVTA